MDLFHVFITKHFPMCCSFLYVAISLPFSMQLDARTLSTTFFFFISKNIISYFPVNLMASVCKSNTASLFEVTN